MSVATGNKSLSISTRIVMLTGGVPASMCFTTFGAVLPKMEAALAHGPTDQLLVKMVIGINGIVMVFGAPMAGVLADKIGRKPVLVWALFLSMLFGASGYFISDLPLMVFSRALLGLAAATALTAVVTMIGDIPDEAIRRRMMGMHIGCSSFSAIVSVPVAGVLADMYWRLPFLLFLVLLPIAALAKFKLVDRYVRHDAVEPQAATGRSFPIPYASMFLGFILGVVALVPLTYIPFRIRDIGVTTATLIAVPMTASSITTSSAAFLFGYARKWISSDGAFALSFTSVAIGMGIIALSTDYRLMVVGTAIFGVGCGWFPTNIMTRVAEFATLATRGRLLGLVKGMYLLATFVAVLVFEPISRVGGAQAVLLVMVAISVIAAAYFFYGDRKRPQVLTQPVPEGAGFQH